MDKKIEKATTEKVVMVPTKKGKEKGFPEGAINKAGELVVNPRTAAKLEVAGLATVKK